jgi:hypothetical protein
MPADIVMNVWESRAPLPETYPLRNGEVNIQKLLCLGWIDLHVQGRWMSSAPFRTSFLQLKRESWQRRFAHICARRDHVPRRVRSLRRRRNGGTEAGPLPSMRRRSLSRVFCSPHDFFLFFPFSQAASVPLTDASLTDQMTPNSNTGGFEASRIRTSTHFERTCGPEAAFSGLGCFDQLVMRTPPIWAGTKKKRLKPPSDRASRSLTAVVEETEPLKRAF